VPVVAAGGIADGRGLAAALALGAAGAWLGTRFLAATEAAIHPDYRRRIVAAGENDTFYGSLRTLANGSRFSARCLMPALSARVPSPEGQT
jgi:NAD(P)H-dependent flavin oxidoreductase YrpB (nitropropane dioxygenase family)